MVQLTARPATDPTDVMVRGYAIGSVPLRMSRAAAGLRVYEQECALHDAHGSGVAAWICRAEQALHAALLTYEAAESTA